MQTDSALRLLRRLQTLAIIMLSPLLRLLSRLLGRRSTTRIQAPVFIVGAPRTGSTIFYQALTNYFDVLYFDNVVSFWHRTVLFGFWRSFRKYGHAPHNSFSAEHGVTHGGHSPSECGEFWYRWLPKDRHFVDKADPAVVSAIRQEVNEVCALFDRPLVFKNLNAGQRLRLIAEAFPDARIIFIRRDPRFVLRSILSARRRIGVKAGQWWSVRPPNYEHYLALPEAQMCAAQIYAIEKQILEDLALFPRDHVFVVDYDELSADAVREMGRTLGLAQRAGGSLPEFSKDAADAIGAQEMDGLVQALSGYPFAELKYEG